ncbi:MAG TPA: hypothetical protein DDW50_17460 [Firmicutes bacterium]|nr:hypothetical protein [Bacillota bacterium]
MNHLNAGVCFIFFCPHGPHDQHGFFTIPARRVYVGDVGHVGEKIKNELKLGVDGGREPNVIRL